MYHMYMSRFANNGLLGGGVGVRVRVGVRGQRKVKGQKKVKALLVEILDITGFLLEGKRAIMSIRQLYSEPFHLLDCCFSERRQSECSTKRL